MDRVVLTGAGGFVGLRLRERLAEAGFDVVALDRPLADTSDLAALRRAVGAVGATSSVVHLAFPTRAAWRRDHPRRALQQVLLSAANVLALASEVGASQVLLASSGKVYGDPIALPIAEDHPAEPTTSLGALKLLEESVLGRGLRALGVQGALGVTSLRIFNVYGPGQRTEFVLPHLVGSLRGGVPLRVGELAHRRDFVHLEDVCAAFETALRRPAPAGELRILNVGTGRSVSVGELIDHLAALSSSSPEVIQEPDRRRPEEAQEERADVSRLRALGWEPRVDLSEGLQALWEGRPAQQ